MRVFEDLKYVRGGMLALALQLPLPTLWHAFSKPALLDSSTEDLRREPSFMRS